MNNQDLQKIFHSKGSNKNTKPEEILKSISQTNKVKRDSFALLVAPIMLTVNIITLIFTLIILAGNTSYFKLDTLVLLALLVFVSFMFYIYFSWLYDVEIITDKFKIKKKPSNK